MKIISLVFLSFLIFTVPTFGQAETESFVNKSKQFRKEGKFDEAIAELNKAIAVQPNNADLYMSRANLYLLTQNKQNLLADVKKASAINPTDKKTLYYGTLSVFKSGQYQESLTLVNNLIALGEPDLAAMELKVSILTHLEDFAAAHAELTRLIELYPNENRLKHNLANSFRLMGDSNTALDSFSAQIVSQENRLNKVENKIENKEAERRLKWDLSALYFSRANIYQNKLEIEKMKADLIKGVEWHPIPMNYERRAVFYAKQKMYDEALADLNKAIEINSDKDVGLFMRRGDVYFSMQKYSEAIKEYEQVLKEKTGLEPLAERRISQAKQKMLENGSQPK
jgi:tetratricopeptide (TPR) repeat protein